MNIINGEIASIKTNGSLSVVEVTVGENKFKTIVIDTPDTVEYLKIGNMVKLLFKETEVAIGIGDMSNISLQNKIAGVITKLELGDLQSKITLKTEIGSIKSIITSDAAQQLNLKEGIVANALIKTNEVMLTA